ncbi:hypothetical protein [Alteromonas sp. BMJM2]|uniref:hypothetical protein n=1 Tax=Alteromonas sp. BMJM2 TaxID=2954241 RepID=UPI0022B472BC|nr:hypothetical protein [Alteromonas sp. BMJM2]
MQTEQDIKRQLILYASQLADSVLLSENTSGGQKDLAEHINKKLKQLREIKNK